MYLTEFCPKEKNNASHEIDGENYVRDKLCTTHLEATICVVD